MKFDLSATVLSIEGSALKRNAVNASYSETDLTLAFAIAHVLSVGVEDLTAIEQQANALATSPPVAGYPEPSALRATAFELKVKRGALALRIANSDAKEVELSAEEILTIRVVAAPRLMPTVLAQVHAVIN